MKKDFTSTSNKLVFCQPGSSNENNMMYTTELNILSKHDEEKFIAKLNYEECKDNSVRIERGSHINTNNCEESENLKFDPVINESSIEINDVFVNNDIRCIESKSDYTNSLIIDSDEELTEPNPWLFETANSLNIKDDKNSLFPKYAESCSHVTSDEELTLLNPDIENNHSVQFKELIKTEPTSIRYFKDIADINSKKCQVSKVSENTDESAKDNLHKIILKNIKKTNKKIKQIRRLFRNVKVSQSNIIGKKTNKKMKRIRRLFRDIKYMFLETSTKTSSCLAN